MEYFVLLGQSVVYWLVIMFGVIVCVAVAGLVGTIEKMSDRTFKIVLVLLDVSFVVALEVAAVRYGLTPEHGFALTMLALFLPVILGTFVAMVIFKPRTLYKFACRHFKPGTKG